MSIGWPKANGRLVVCASVYAGRVRALFALPCASQLANFWAAGIRSRPLRIALLFVSSKRRLWDWTLGEN